VRVYRNLRIKGYSILSMESGTRYMRVVGHMRNVTLYLAKPIIQQSEQRRAKRTRERNVHAYIEGYLRDFIPVDPDSAKRVKYDPYENRKFMVDGAPFMGSALMSFDSTGAYAIA